MASPGPKAWAAPLTVKRPITPHLRQGAWTSQEHDVILRRGSLSEIPPLRRQVSDGSSSGSLQSFGDDRPPPRRASTGGNQTIAGGARQRASAAPGLGARRHVSFGTEKSSAATPSRPSSAVNRDGPQSATTSPVSRFNADKSPRPASVGGAGLRPPSTAGALRPPPAASGQGDELVRRPSASSVDSVRMPQGEEHAKFNQLPMSPAKQMIRQISPDSEVSVVSTRSGASAGSRPLRRPSPGKCSEPASPMSPRSPWARKAPHGGNAGSARSAGSRPVEADSGTVALDFVAGVLRAHPKVLDALRLTGDETERKRVEALAAVDDPFTLLRFGGGVDYATSVKVVQALPEAVQAPERSILLRLLLCLQVTALSVTAVVSVIFLILTISEASKGVENGWNEGTCQLVDFSGTCEMVRALGLACKLKVAVNTGGGTYTLKDWRPTKEHHSKLDRVTWAGDAFRCCDVSQRQDCCEFKREPAHDPTRISSWGGGNKTLVMCDNMPYDVDETGEACPSGGWQCLFKARGSGESLEVVNIKLPETPDPGPYLAVCLVFFFVHTCLWVPLLKKMCTDWRRRREVEPADSHRVRTPDTEAPQILIDKSEDLQEVVTTIDIQSIDKVPSLVVESVDSSPRSEGANNPGGKGDGGSDSGLSSISGNSIVDDISQVAAKLERLKRKEKMNGKQGRTAMEHGVLEKFARKFNDSHIAAAQRGGQLRPEDSFQRETSGSRRGSRSDEGRELSPAGGSRRSSKPDAVSPGGALRNAGNVGSRPPSSMSTRNTSPGPASRGIPKELGALRVPKRDDEIRPGSSGRRTSQEAKPKKEASEKKKKTPKKPDSWATTSTISQQLWWHKQTKHQQAHWEKNVNGLTLAEKRAGYGLTDDDA